MAGLLRWLLDGEKRDVQNQARWLDEVQRESQGIQDKATEQTRLKALRPLLGKFDPATAKQVGTAAISADPQAQAIGTRQLEGLLGQADPQYKQGTALNALQIEGQQGANRVAKLREAFIPTEQQFARDQAGYAAAQDRRQGAESGQRVKLNDLALQAAMAPPAPPAPPTDAQIFEQAAGFPLPKDYIAGFNPNTKQLEPIPAPNTEPYRKAAAEVDTGEKLSRTITRYLALVDAVGPTATEFIGPKAGALRAAREDVISAYRERAALGTPTGGELARVEDILPDPTGYYRNSWSALGALGTAGLASGYIKESQMSPYRELLEAITQDLDTAYKRNWWIPATPGIRAP